MWISKQTARTVGRVGMHAAKIADVCKGVVNARQVSKLVRGAVWISPTIGVIVAVVTMFAHKGRCVYWGNVKRNVPWVRRYCVWVDASIRKAIRIIVVYVTSVAWADRTASKASVAVQQARHCAVGYA